ncbi:MAG TPA: hypothetical protein VIK14_07580, partial [Ignavibacteria bacterium]
MSYCFSFIVVFFLVVTTDLSGQESIQLNQPSKLDTAKDGILLPDQINGQSQFIKSIEEYIQLNQAPPGEKVCLHTDRNSYMHGDTVWFKAYSWYGYEQVPDTISGILYVDLINHEGKIKLKR